MKNIKDAINNIAENTEKFFKDLERGHKCNVPTEASAILYEANLDRILSLTRCLNRWVTTTSLSDGDLVLAYANLGSIVESWLMLFYAIYNLDYKDEILYKNKKEYIKGSRNRGVKILMKVSCKFSKNSTYCRDYVISKIKNPDELTFELLKKFAYNNLFEKGQYNMREFKFMDSFDIKMQNQEIKKIRKWIGDVQTKRNSIHSFMERDVGNSNEFYESIVTLELFVDSILNRMPQFEDYVY